MYILKTPHAKNISPSNRFMPCLALSFTLLGLAQRTRAPTPSAPEGVYWSICSALRLHKLWPVVFTISHKRPVTQSVFHLLSSPYCHLRLTLRLGLGLRLWLWLCVCFAVCFLRPAAGVPLLAASLPELLASLSASLPVTASASLFVSFDPMLAVSLPELPGMLQRSRRAQWPSPERFGIFKLVWSKWDEMVSIFQVGTH
eukprot:COSAG02_NODE_3446_length_6727_cov_3.084339_2_plen_200_part_00